MGYDVDRFVDEINEGLLCGICRDVLEDPLQAPCEHAYCSACIMAWLVQHSICPEDRRPLTAPLLRPLFRYMRNDLDKLQIRCRNCQAGCQVVCNLETIHRHEAECEFHTQQCPSVGCNAMLGRDQFEEHLQVCEFRRNLCPNGCGLAILNSEDVSHNCVAELRNALELFRSEMIGKLVEQRQELELLLDAQRRHMTQKQAFLQSQIESLKSQMTLALQDVQSLRESTRRHELELEQGALAKQRLLAIISTLQAERSSPNVVNRTYLCRQSSTPVESSKQ
ncbi:hypothetical protein LSH36_112g00057 [Paralvinella palmiformis]|uniref:E3 ubiquitin-protein ligase NRDP1 n=1 Tax=Paralvinella palmiformis TaxID=53620 RepID=A0AAD9JYK6_9ANNE|nr:hypothetical protein LSH36_112g00057 [Paralvinella palmiformis]